MKPERSRSPVEEQGTLELLKNALHDGRELVQVELELAKRDPENDLRAVTRAAVAFTVALLFMVASISLLTFALVLGGSEVALAAGLTGALALGAGALGFRLLPHSIERGERQL